MRPNNVFIAVDQMRADCLSMLNVLQRLFGYSYVFIVGQMPQTILQHVVR